MLGGIGRYAAGAVLCVLLSACSSLGPKSIVRENLSLAKSAPAKPYKLATIPDGTSPDLFIALAFSGGGKRSAAFGYGALQALNKISVTTSLGDRRLTEEIDLLSGVSGGSFMASAFALEREAIFLKPGQTTNKYVDFLNYDLEADIVGLIAFPWHWDWVLNPDWGTNDEMALLYNRLLYGDATFEKLAQLGRPLLAVQATDFANEAPFTFTQYSFDLICSDLSQYPLARSVAASNGFPILFSPIRLGNFSGTSECPLTARPKWVEQHLADADEFSRLRNLAERADHYITGSDTDTAANGTREKSYVHLLDGGVGDNLALRGLIQMILPATQVPEERLPKLQEVRKILVISIDGQSTPDREIAQIPYVDSMFRILGAATSTAIDSYGFESLLAAKATTEELADQLSRMDCETAGVLADKPCRDITPYFAHVSLTDLKNDARLTELKKIRTGLSIPPADVQALIQAGHDAVFCDANVAKFLADANPRFDRPTVACAVEPGVAVK